MAKSKKDKKAGSLPANMSLSVENQRLFNEKLNHVSTVGFERFEYISLLSLIYRYFLYFRDVKIRLQHSISKPDF